jgi:hypothetical protein
MKTINPTTADQAIQNIEFIAKTNFSSGVYQLRVTTAIPTLIKFEVVDITTSQGVFGAEFMFYYNKGRLNGDEQPRLEFSSPSINFDISKSIPMHLKIRAMAMFTHKNDAIVKAFELMNDLIK